MEELDNRYKSHWAKPEYSNTNSAVNEAYLTPIEKKIYYYLNLARANPQLFATTYVTGYEGSNGYGNSSDFNAYKSSLIAELHKLPALPLLSPNKAMYDIALCHAKGIGEQGLLTHSRAATGCPSGYAGECIGTGKHNALDVVMSFLIDSNNASKDTMDLGHRKICLSSGYRFLGVAIQRHKTYTECSVLDFAR